VPVDYIGTGVKSKKKGKEKDRQRLVPSMKQEAKKSFSSKGNFRHMKNSHKSDKIVCFRCGRNHLAPSCSLPRSTKCLECGGFGHLKIVCKKKEQTNYVEDIATVDKVSEHLKFRSKYTVPLLVEQRKVLFDVDCGAAVTLVGYNWINSNFPNLEIFKTDFKLRSYCKKNFAPIGFVKVKHQYHVLLHEYQKL